MLERDKYNRIIIHKRLTNNFSNGTIHSSNNCGLYKVINYINSSNIYIEFIETGYKTKSSLSHLKAGVIHDPLSRTVKGVGYLGEEYKTKICKKYNKKFYKRAYSVWHNMISRCYYDSPNNDYHLYGKLGVTVDSSWHNFSKFFYDIQKLPG